jgi:CheY-like chemotaxis protein
MSDSTSVPGRGLTVLVVDDNRDSAEMMQVLLGMLGHTVEVAHTGRAAIDTAASLQPHVILLDIGLPDMTGYDVAREIRAARPHGVRLIALTGWGQEEARQQAREAGFDHHLTKPADPAVLEKLLSEAAASLAP